MASAAGYAGAVMKMRKKKNKTIKNPFGKKMAGDARPTAKT